MSNETKLRELSRAVMSASTALSKIGKLDMSLFNNDTWKLSYLFWVKMITSLNQ